MAASANVFGIYVATEPPLGALWEALVPFHFCAQARWLSILGLAGGLSEGLQRLYGSYWDA